LVVFIIIAFHLEFSILERAIEQFPFPIHRLQTARSREFLAVKAQEKLMEYGIKFRPNKARSPLSEWEGRTLWENGHAV